MACRRCSNYIFILYLTPGFNELGKDKRKARRETFKFRDFVKLILEIWRYTHDSLFVMLFVLVYHSPLPLSYRGTLYKHGPSWISNHMPSKLWDEITYPSPNFNGCTVEVWEWISNFHSIFYDGCYYISMLELKLSPWILHCHWGNNCPIPGEATLKNMGTVSLEINRTDKTLNQAMHAMKSVFIFDGVVDNVCGENSM